MSDRFVAVDWGTTNRRAFLIEDGEVVSSERDATGILAVPAGGFGAEVAALRARYGDLPVLLAGMVGSNRGWVETPYIGCPATLGEIAAHLVYPETGIAVLPGIAIAEGHHGDVMRGEEVQLLGAVAAGLVPADALLCQPGTHSKWVRMAAGAIADFTTAITGEMFALLRDHALIGSSMSTPVENEAAFIEGIAVSGDGDLLAKLFGVRAASVLGLRDDADAASYVSGLLIGTDCRARVEEGDHVHLLADAELGGLYATALRAIGGTATLVDSHAAFVAGIVRIRSMIR